MEIEEMKIDPNLITLADYPHGEWVYFTDDNGATSMAWSELVMARFNEFVESKVGPQGIAGPMYHRITEKGRDFVNKNYPRDQR